MWRVLPIIACIRSIVEAVLFDTAQLVLQSEMLLPPPLATHTLLLVLKPLQPVHYQATPYPSTLRSSRVWLNRLCKDVLQNIDVDPCETNLYQGPLAVIPS